MLSMIATETEVMAQLIGDLLEFSSTWLGNSIPLNPEHVDLEKLCREVVDGFHTSHPERTLQFHQRGDLTGNWDAARLRQVVSNLIGNALQHGSPDGPVELSAASEASSVVLSVHNEGAPIPPELLPTLFDPLVRHATADSLTHRAPGSIGLGLYIVREIITAQEGAIEVTSNSEHGTTFTVSIPRHSTEGDEHSDAQSPRGDSLPEQTSAEKSNGSRRGSATRLSPLTGAKYD